MNAADNPVNISLIPLRWWETVIFFGVPTLVMAGSVYWLLPHLVSLGLSEYLGLQIASLIPYSTLFMAALIAARLEGLPWKMKSFRSRLRLRKLHHTDRVWALALVIFTYASYLPLRFGISTLVRMNLIVLPVSLPRIIDPRLSVPLVELTGGPVQGNWLLVGITLVVLLVNILGEELWWRGYLLPRQEVSLGNRAWLVHGCLWALFHAFKYWELFAVLPVSLGLSFAAQRRKNTWLGIIAHFSVNCLGVVGLILLAVG